MSLILALMMQVGPNPVAPPPTPASVIWCAQLLEDYIIVSSQDLNVVNSEFYNYYLLPK